jgi:hypothetical protein
MQHVTEKAAITLLAEDLEQTSATDGIWQREIGF